MPKKQIMLNFKDSALVSEKDIKTAAHDIKDYVSHLQDVAKSGNYAEPESSINLPTDKKLLREVSDLVKQKVSKKLKFIIVIGIGGSNLGTSAIFNALRDSNANPKIISLDTTFAGVLDELLVLLKKEVKKSSELLINLVSKSGSTTEAISNFEALYPALKKRFSDIDKRIVVTTDHKTKLWEMAEAHGFALLGMPKQVGGRFSVFSAVGLFPLMAVGIDIKELLKGAQEMRDRCLDNNPNNNPALTSASLIYLHHIKGIRINNNFFFNSRLEHVGKWYRQLMGESIGKEKDLDGEVINEGITPIVSVGTTDMHSMSQLYFGGPRDKFTNFVYAPSVSKNANVPKNTLFKNLVAGIGGKSFDDIIKAVLGSVKVVYKKDKLPFMEVVLSELNENYLGQYLQFKMIEMMYLARLMNLNAFNQPSVEAYKTETRRILGN